MKKFFSMLEEIWVAVAFAEEGVYETEWLTDSKSIIHETAHQHVAM
jgi:hypothetical protein